MTFDASSDRTPLLPKHKDSQEAEDAAPPPYTPYSMSVEPSSQPSPLATTTTAAAAEGIAGGQVRMVYCAHELEGCPRGGEHILRSRFGLLAWCLAICCFPEGILCCLCMKKEQCIKCKQYFD